MNGNKMLSVHSYTNPISLNEKKDPWIVVHSVENMKNPSNKYIELMVYCAALRNLRKSKLLGRIQVIFFVLNICFFCIFFLLIA